MLTKVEVYTERGQMLELPIEDLGGGFLIKDIEGLDPNKANIISSNFALLDGEQYQSSSGEKRNLLLHLKYSLNHTDSVRMRRNRLYGFLMPKSKVTLRFYMTDFPTVDIQGYVEDFTAPLFVQDPESIISIICHEPAFYTQNTIPFNGATTETPSSGTISYGGSIEAGFLFKMVVNRAVSGFVINHNFANGTGSALTFSAPLVAGDVIDIDTNDGSKGAYLTRAGVKKSMLYAVSPNSDWIDLYPGENTIRVYAVGTPIPYSIEYRERFGGL